MKPPTPSAGIIRLGLIGDNLAGSQSPRLHRIAGRLCRLDVTYDPLVPAALGQDFDAVFRRCQEDGYRGLNITYPYKETVVSRLAVDDPVVRAVAACNTVVFEASGARGFNTDYSGFIAAYRESFGEISPGKVAVAGAGGVGRAIAFALAQLGATELRLFDSTEAKAQALKASLASRFAGLRVEIPGSISDAASGADGLVNCTPAGMAGVGGTAIPSSVIGAQRWAFDAVYTPVETIFLRNARAAGLALMTGYELFFHQAVDAFHAFTGRRVDPHLLRRELLLLDNQVLRSLDQTMGIRGLF